MGHLRQLEEKRQKIHLWIASTSERRPPETASIHTVSHHSTDEQEQNPSDEARDYCENRKGRWVRVHGIARRTPLTQRMTKSHFARRRTTVKFLGQQSEMTVDDTWPQLGAMRSLWKGTTEFRTRDMPQDDTCEPNRHHSSIIPLFRNHLTRTAVAMPPSLVNVTGEIPICPLCHTPKMPRRKGDAWFWGFQNYPTCTAPTTTTPPVPQHLKRLLLKQQIQAVNDRVPAKGCRHLLGKPWVDVAQERETLANCVES